MPPHKQPRQHRAFNSYCMTASSTQPFLSCPRGNNRRRHPVSFITLRRGERRERRGLGPLRSPRGSSRPPCRPRTGCRCTSATTKIRTVQRNAIRRSVERRRAAVEGTEHSSPSSMAPFSVSGGTGRDEAFGYATVSRRILRETAVGALNKPGASSSPDHDAKRSICQDPDTPPGDVYL